MARAVTAVVLMVPVAEWADRILLKAITWCITVAQQ
jgi:hypothetical protein